MLLFFRKLITSPTYQCLISCLTFPKRKKMLHTRSKLIRNLSSEIFSDFNDVLLISRYWVLLVTCPLEVPFCALLLVPWCDVSCDIVVIMFKILYLYHPLMTKGRPPCNFCIKHTIIQF